MKKILFVALGLLGLPSMASAINLSTGDPITLTFDAVPASTDWSTITAGLSPTGAGTITDNVTFDSTFQPTTAASINAALPTSTTNPPSQNAAGRYNTTLQGIQTKATGGAAALLMGTFTNTSGTTITDISFSYPLLANSLNAGGSVEEIPGHRVYWSLTGAANSWTPLGNFGFTVPDSGTHPAQTQNFAITGLGGSWANGGNLYVVWADDNGSGADTTGETSYFIDNMVVDPTLGGAPVPQFGTVTPNQAQGFEGGGLNFNNGATGTVTPVAGSNALQVVGTPLNATTDLVDLRGVNNATEIKKASVDLKAWEGSATSDFEASDRIAAIVEWSSDGLNFQNLPIVDLIGAAALDPFDPNNHNPADQIRNTFGPTPAQNNANEPWRHFEVTLPAAAQTARVRVILNVNSADPTTGEFAAVDNISIFTVPVPEPGSIAMIGLGMIGMIGYGIRRGRNNRRGA